MVGWILMLAGMAGLILFLYFWRRQGRHERLARKRSGWRVSLPG
jgi:hypothetical protein